MYMKELIIFGTGAVAAEITSNIEDGNWGASESLCIKGYVTSDDSGGENWHKYGFKSPYLGSFADYEIEQEDYFILALGAPEAKRKIVRQIKERGGKFLTLIHPTAVVAKTAIIGEGNIINPFVMIGPNVKLGDFNLLTSQSVISHDCIVGCYNFFATSLLCGHTVVGDSNYFGIRSTTIPDVVIGNRNTIQAGMIVDKNLENDTTVFHRFKEKVMIMPNWNDHAKL